MTNFRSLLENNLDDTVNDAEDFPKNTKSFAKTYDLIQEYDYNILIDYSIDHAPILILIYWITNEAKTVQNLDQIIFTDYNTIYLNINSNIFFVFVGFLAFLLNIDIIIYQCRI